MKNIIAYLCISLAVVITIIMMVQKTEIPIEEKTIVKTESIHIEEPKKEKLIVTIEETIDTDKTDDINVFESIEIPNDVFEKMNGLSYLNNDIIQRDDLRLLKLTYMNFDYEAAYGEIIVHKDVADEVLDIFKILYENEYPIDKIILVDYFDADDNLSMENNNTHAFNFRYITGGTSLSNHAYGLAIDINPMQNPYIMGNLVLPEGAEVYVDRSIYQLGMVIKDDLLYKAFTSRGWSWGGDWNSIKDYQHFEKKINGLND